MKGFVLIGALIIFSVIFGCAKTGSGKTAATNDVMKAVPLKNENAITGYKDINWGDPREKVMAKYAKDPNYSMEWNILGKLPHLDLNMRDPNSPVDKINIYFYKDQVQQVVILYKYKNAHSKDLFNDLTAKYDGYGMKHTDARTGPIVGTFQGTKFTRKWIDKTTIVHMDYFKDYEKGTFIWIGNFTLLSVRLIDREIKDNQAVKHDE